MGTVGVLVVGAWFCSVAAALSASPRAARRAVPYSVSRSVSPMCSSSSADQEEPPLSTRVEALVAKRCTLRSERQWRKADAVKDELERLGVKLQDRHDGLTDWRFWSPLAAKSGSNSGSAAESIPQLARLAAEVPGDRAEVARLAARVCQLLSTPPPPMLLGRVAADSVFDLALAGVGASSDAFESDASEQLASREAALFGGAHVGREGAPLEPQWHGLFFSSLFLFRPHNVPERCSAPAATSHIAEDAALLESLASLQAQEFTRWRRPQARAPLGAWSVACAREGMGAWLQASCVPHSLLLARVPPQARSAAASAST